MFLLRRGSDEVVGQAIKPTATSFLTSATHLSHIFLFSVCGTRKDENRPEAAQNTPIVVDIS